MTASGSDFDDDGTVLRRPPRRSAPAAAPPLPGEPAAPAIIPAARPAAPRPEPARPRPAAPRPAAPPPTAAPVPAAMPSGGRPAPRRPAAAAPAEVAARPSIGEVGGFFANPLVAAASPMLSLVGQLRNTLSHPDVVGLQRQVIAELKGFEERAVAKGCPVEDVRAARYVLCSVLDETVLTTPWGSESAWSTQSLLSIFHNETWGGEKVFLILDRARDKPQRYLDLIEFIDVCLALGFEGRFRVVENGLYQLEEIRDELYRIIRSHRGEPTKELSASWRTNAAGRQLRRYVPLWVVFAVAGCLLLGVYFAFQLAVDDLAAPRFEALERLGQPGEAQR